MITGLPTYMPPVVEDVYCICRTHYRVFVGVEDYQAQFAEREAMELGAVFVDARRMPFIACACGQALVFAVDCALTIQ
jgi:hypothetical protein